MVTIRTFEEKVGDLFAAGKIPGFTHLSIGQEGIPTGVCAALRPEDYIVSNHRGHGHTIAKGARLNLMMAEIFGKATGVCRGKGGSMHIADFSVGMLGANGVVGGGFSIATGAGLSIKLRGTDQVAVCFFGDGAANRGTFHEAVNMAAVWKLPVVFVCENNQYASTTAFRATCPVADIADRSVGYGIPGVKVDGNDVTRVAEAAEEAVGRARHGGGPTLLECKTYRMRGHFVGDPERYRTREEVQSYGRLDPIRRLAERLIAAGVAPGTLEEVQARACAAVEQAVQFAEESPFPQPADALTDLFRESGVLSHG